MIPGVKVYKQITYQGLTIIDNKDEELLIPADTIITTTPPVSSLEITRQLEGEVPEI